MGIINVTPDSFSGDGLATADRGQEQIVAAALAQATAFVDAGAELVDVGAESTRPASVYGERAAVDAQTELELAIPVVAALAQALEGRAIVSIDTSKGVVAQEAVRVGARMVNDVWGGLKDPGTVEAAASSGAHLVLMHNAEEARYPEGVVPAVIEGLRAAVAHAEGLGMAKDRLIVDPGIGFAKTIEQNLEILHRLAEIKAQLGLPLLVGTSRKRFIGELLGGVPPDERAEGTAATVALAIAAGADIVRVHDVAHVARTVRVADAIARFGTRAAR
jgi:dihydropteroate synthase